MKPEVGSGAADKKGNLAFNSWEWQHVLSVKLY